MKAIPFTIRDREISEGRVMLAQQVKSGAGAVSACRRRDGGGTWAKSLNLGFENTKIGGFGGSVVCDRVVRLVLGGVGFRLLEKTLGEGR